MKPSGEEGMRKQRIGSKQRERERGAVFSVTRPPC